MILRGYGCILRIRLRIVVVCWVGRWCCVLPVIPCRKNAVGWQRCLRIINWRIGMVWKRICMRFRPYPCMFLRMNSVSFHLSWGSFPSFRRCRCCVPRHVRRLASTHRGWGCSLRICNRYCLTWRRDFPCPSVQPPRPWRFVKFANGVIHWVIPCCSCMMESWRQESSIGVPLEAPGRTLFWISGMSWRFWREFARLYPAR
mmetsp:Transcript_25045/g.53983  ORF Transcript_25045/g.53983 Transcript_25045/m.53983 type:complete len:201 (+) Transcript_25045:1498-2100(+)